MMTDQEFENFCLHVERKHKAELREGLNKLILKIKTESYDKGYKAGANQQNNKPCVCGFWGRDSSSE